MVLLQKKLCELFASGSRRLSRREVVKVPNGKCENLVRVHSRSACNCESNRESAWDCEAHAISDQQRMRYNNNCTL